MAQQQGEEEGAAMLALSLAGMAVGQDVLQEPAWRAEVSVFSDPLRQAVHLWHSL